MNDPSNVPPGSIQKRVTRLCNLIVGIRKGPSSVLEVIRSCREGKSMNAVILKDKDAVRSLQSHGYLPAQQVK